MVLEDHHIRTGAGLAVVAQPERLRVTVARQAADPFACFRFSQRRQLDPAGERLPTEAYVFGDEIGRRRASLKTACNGTLSRAKITGLHFRDLRREAGSRWMDAGIPLADSTLVRAREH